MPTVTINGLDHHYEDEGPKEAPIIVFQHGATGSHHQFTEEHTPSINQKYRCIADDARGMGGSAHVETMPHTAWVDDLLGLFDHLEIDQAHLFGSSRGSRVALRFTIEHPERVKSLMLDGAIIAMNTAGDAALNRNGGDGSKLPPATQADNQRRHGEDWMDVVRNYFNLRNLPGLHDYLNTRDEAHKIECPTLIMHSDTDDGTHPLASTLELFSRLPKAKLALYPMMGGYSVNRHGGARFAALVNEWVDYVESGKEVKNAFDSFDSCREVLKDLMGAEVVGR